MKPTRHDVGNKVFQKSRLRELPWDRGQHSKIIRARPSPLHIILPPPDAWKWRTHGTNNIYNVIPNVYTSLRYSILLSFLSHPEKKQLIGERIYFIPQFQVIAHHSGIQAGIQTASHSTSTTRGSEGDCMHAVSTLTQLRVPSMGTVSPHFGWLFSPH